MKQEEHISYLWLAPRQTNICQDEHLASQMASGMSQTQYLYKLKGSQIFMPNNNPTNRRWAGYCWTVVVEENFRGSLKMSVLSPEPSRNHPIHSGDHQSGWDSSSGNHGDLFYVSWQQTGSRPCYHLTIATLSVCVFTSWKSHPHILVAWNCVLQRLYLQGLYGHGKPTKSHGYFQAWKSHWIEQNPKGFEKKFMVC